MIVYIAKWHHGDNAEMRYAAFATFGLADVFLKTMEMLEPEDFWGEDILTMEVCKTKLDAIDGFFQDREELAKKIMFGQEE